LNVPVARRSLIRSESFRPIAIGFFFFFLQQFCGINPIQINLSQIMRSRFGPTIAASSKLIAGFFCASLIRRFGRKAVWCAGCGIALFVLAYASSHQIELLAVASTFIYLFSFCLGLAPMPWFIIPELFDDDIRSNASSCLVTVNCLLTFAATFLYPIVGDAIGYPATFRSMGVLSFLGVAFGLLMIPDQPRAKVRSGDELLNSPSDDV
jgi:predicted MFS family arabinose efflux permease